MASMEAVLQENPNGLEVIDYIEKACFKGKLLHMNEFGEPIGKPVPSAIKMEELLRTALEQRDKCTRAKKDFTPNSAAKIAG